MKTHLNAEFYLPDKATDMAVKLDQQVYGDTHPDKSSVNTQTGASMGGIQNDPSLPRMRC
jgi:hypothetical protein